ncbi:MAG TPA: hypothetical protein VHD85_11595 [Terracidiphilus sp.]|nr:hypothetical protein [Terracidiphilus sp.]
MRFCLKAAAVLALFALPAAGFAATCAMQDEMHPADQAAIADAGTRLLQAIASQDETTIKATLLPAEANEWGGIQSAVEQAGPIIGGGHLQFRNAFLLDASMQTAPADTDFFCSNASGSMNITLSMRDLPPGRYAVLLADALGSPLAGQVGLVLAWNPTVSQWQLAGLSIRPGALDGHDGVWYWRRARSMATADPWTAWYDYDLAAYLQLPFDFISSPNLQKLRQEQERITPAPRNSFPLTLPQGDRTWKVDSVVLDTSLRAPDLAVVYESTGVTDPAAQRTEATSVLSAFLKVQPGIRANFHGLWAVAAKNGQHTPVMELPMSQIPQ